MAALAFTAVSCKSNMCCCSAILEGRQVHHKYIIYTFIITPWSKQTQIFVLLKMASWYLPVPMHRVSWKHVMKAKYIRKMVLFSSKLNNSIKSDGVALCSQLKPRLNNFCVKGEIEYVILGWQ